MSLLREQVMNELQEKAIEVPLWGWIVFHIFVISLIILDLFVFNRGKKEIGVKQALVTSAAWISLAFLFNLVIYYFYGIENALNFLAGYLIEESLSIDNLFVFIVIFEYFCTPRKYQHKVLFWGILGAIIMRALFIFLGIELVHRFHWILYLFGIFLIFAAIKMALPKDKQINPEDNLIIRLIKKIFPVTPSYVEDKFFVKKDNKWWGTPLFITLITIEITDLIFAIDSIPAIMAITLDPFIVYTSNVFAILGLRSLYFALANLMPMFHLLKYGLAAILGFVGIKMLLAFFIHIPIGISLGFIALALILSIGTSLLCPNKYN
jgi:tellurite resistance protein TerC